MFGLGLSQYVPIVLYAAGVAISFLSIFYRVEIGLVFLVPLLPLQNVIYKLYKLPQGHNFVDILVISMLIGWAVRSVARGRQIFEKAPLNWPIALYIIITGLSLLLGYSYLGTGFEGLGTDNLRLMNWKNHLFLTILCLITLNNVRTLKWMEILVVGMLLSIFLNDFFFFQSFKWLRHHHYQHDMRIGGALRYLGPNELGAFFAQYLMVVVGLLLFETRRLGKALLALLAMFTGYCLMYSFSRTAYLAFAVGMIFLLLARSRKLLLVFLVLLFASPWILPVSVKERIQMTTLSEDEKMEIEMKGAGRLSTTEQKYDPSTQGRFEIWKLAMDIFKKNPFLGTGYDTFGALQGFDTHNNYLKVLAEIGIMGFLIYLYLYYLAFKCGWNLFRIATEGPIKGLGLGFAACVITNMLCNLAHDNWTYLSLMGFYWVLLALVVRASMITNQLQQKEVNSSHLNDS